MKVLTITNEKGGVGKSLFSTQFAYYAALKFGLKVAVLDLDQQGNSSAILSGSAYVKPAPYTAYELLSARLDERINKPDGALTLISAEDRLTDLEKQGSKVHELFTENLLSNLQRLSESGLELLIIDTNPSADIRSNLALLVCTQLLCPLALNREPIDGIVRLCNRVDLCSQLNPNLPRGFLGILPNLLESSWRFQMQNAKELMQNFDNLLLKAPESLLQCYLNPQHKLEIVKDAEGEAVFTQKQSFCAIKTHAALAEAQQRSLPIWEMPHGAEAWSELKRTFFILLEKLEIRKDLESDPQTLALCSRLKELYGPKSATKVLRQFYLTDNPKALPKLSLKDINLLRTLRGTLAFSSF